MSYVDQLMISLSAYPTVSQAIGEKLEGNIAYHKAAGQM